MARHSPEFDLEGRQKEAGAPIGGCSPQWAAAFKVGLWAVPRHLECPGFATAKNQPALGPRVRAKSLPEVLNFLCLRNVS